MVYVFLADGFEEIEAITPIDVLRRGGIDVKTVGVTGKTVFGSHNIPIVCDEVVEDVKAEDIDCVFLPGGLPGTTNLENNSRVNEFIDKAYKENAIIAAICAAPSILGHKGLLKGKKATCYNGFETELQGAEYTGEPVEIDGNIITARGAGVALDFAFELLTLITGTKEKTEKLRMAMLCK